MVVARVDSQRCCDVVQVVDRRPWGKLRDLPQAFLDLICGSYRELDDRQLNFNQGTSITNTINLAIEHCARLFPPDFVR